MWWGCVACGGVVWRVVGLCDEVVVMVVFMWFGMMWLCSLSGRRLCGSDLLFCGFVACGRVFVVWFGGVVWEGCVMWGCCCVVLRDLVV